MAKHFKARFEHDISGRDGGIRAMDVYFDASNIISAATMMQSLANTLGYDEENITRLIETDTQ